MTKSKKDSGIKLVVPTPTVKLSDLFSITRGQNPVKKAKGIESQVNLITAASISPRGYMVASESVTVKCLPAFLQLYRVEKYDVVLQARSGCLKVGVFEGKHGLANSSVYILRLKVGISDTEKRKWAAAVCMSISAQRIRMTDQMIIIPNKNNQVSKYLPIQEVGDTKIITDIDTALELMLKERQAYFDFIKTSNDLVALVAGHLNR